MGTFSSIKESKHFSGELKDTVVYCAERINHNSSFKVDELNEDEGMISCIYLGMVALDF